MPLSGYSHVDNTCIWRQGWHLYPKKSISTFHCDLHLLHCLHFMLPNWTGYAVPSHICKSAAVCTVEDSRPHREIWFVYSNLTAHRNLQYWWQPSWCDTWRKEVSEERSVIRIRTVKFTESVIWCIERFSWCTRTSWRYWITWTSGMWCLIFIYMKSEV